MCYAFKTWMRWTDHNFMFCSFWFVFVPQVKTLLRPYTHKWGLTYFFGNWFIKPAWSAGGSQIKKIPYQAPPTQLGPENVHFGKRLFWDQHINVRIFIYFWKFKELPGATFLCIEFSTRVPKNGPKNGPKFKKRRKMTKITFTHLGHSI